MAHRFCLNSYNNSQLKFPLCIQILPLNFRPNKHSKWSLSIHGQGPPPHVSEIGCREYLKLFGREIEVLQDIN
jgi:hypothetical protein